MLPTSESTRRSWTSSPNRARTNSPIESDSVDVRGRKRLERGAGLAPPRQQAGGGQRQDLAGQSEHQPVGDRMQPVVPHRGADRLGRDELVAQADPTRQRDRLGHPGQERVGALVDTRDACERRGVDLAADALARLEDRHVDVAGVGQGDGGGQPTDAGTDDGDPTRRAHGATARTRSARAAMIVASSFTQAVRSKARPCDAARSAASMSRS